MGNCCGKSSSDNFQSPGRTLGSAPPQGQAPRAAVPPQISTAGTPFGGTGATESAGDARSAAARAAEVSLSVSPAWFTIRLQVT